MISSVYSQMFQEKCQKGWENMSEYKYLANMGNVHIGVFGNIFINSNLKLQQNLKVTK